MKGSSPTMRGRRIRQCLASLRRGKGSGASTVAGSVEESSLSEVPPCAEPFDVGEFLSPSAVSEESPPGCSGSDFESWSFRTSGVSEEW
jgi:hypothetical protein